MSTSTDAGFGPRRLSPVAIARRGLRRLIENLGLLGPIYRAIERGIARKAGPWRDADDGLPTPSPHQVTLVAGHASLESFLQQGRHLAAFLELTAERHGVPMAAPGRVLDFGCGCGRTARFLAPRVIAAGGEFIGVDTNRELVAWSARNLPGTYLRNAPRPPAPVESGTVRLMYAISVFTHLPRESMAAWLADYERMLAPGGLALVSFFDEDAAHPDLRATLGADGFGLNSRALEGSNFMASCATHEAFAKLCAPYLRVEEILGVKRTGETQAWAVLRKPG